MSHARNQARSLFLVLAVLLLASCAGGESDAQKTSQKGTPAASLTSEAEDAYIFGLGPVAMYKWYQVFAIVSVPGFRTLGSCDSFL
jgi:hypothetical protein